MLCDFFHRIPLVARFTPGGALDGTWDGDGHAEPVGTFDGELFAVELAAGGDVGAAGRTLEAFAVKLGATGAPVPAFSGDGVAETRFGASGGNGCGSSGLAFGVVDGGAGRVLITGQASLSGIAPGASPWPGSALMACSTLCGGPTRPKPV